MEKDFYIYLIIKKLNGSSIQSENDELDSWIAENPENKRLYDEIILSWEKAGEYQLPFDVNRNKEFDKILEKINESVKTTSGRTISKTIRLNYLKWISAAAVLLLMVGVFLFQNYFSDSDEPLQYVAGDTIKEIKLEDGTVVTLNKNSRLVILNKFNKNLRNVELTGQAFFKVSPNIDRPFQVFTKDGEVRVLGTSFDVRYDDATRITEVTVQEGKVRFGVKKSDEYIELIQGEKGELDINRSTLKKIRDKNQNNLAWFSHKLNFRDSPLINVVSDLSKHYKIKIIVIEDYMKKCLFSGQYDATVPLKNIVDDITAVMNMKSQIDTNQIILSEGTCN